jgi:hypothetical protein
MTEVLPSRPRTKRSYAAVAPFLLVYLGVLVVVFAPREMIASQSGAAFYAAEN